MKARSYRILRNSRDEVFTFQLFSLIRALQCIKFKYRSQFCDCRIERQVASHLTLRDIIVCVHIARRNLSVVRQKAFSTYILNRFTIMHAFGLQDGIAARELRTCHSYLKIQFSHYLFHASRSLLPKVISAAKEAISWDIPWSWGSESVYWQIKGISAYLSPAK